MHDILQHMTSYYNRYYGDYHGEMSSEWLHDYIAAVSPPPTATIFEHELTQPRSSPNRLSAPTSLSNTSPILSANLQLLHASSLKFAASPNL